MEVEAEAEDACEGRVSGSTEGRVKGVTPSKS